MGECTWLWEPQILYNGFGITREPPRVFFLFYLYLKIPGKTVRDKKSRRKYIVPCPRVTEEKNLLPTPLYPTSQNSVREDAVALCRARKWEVYVCRTLQGSDMRWSDRRFHAFVQALGLSVSYLSKCGKWFTLRLWQRVMHLLLQSFSLHLPTLMWLPESCIPSLSFNFLLCLMWVILTDLTRILQASNEMRHVRVFDSYKAQYTRYCYYNNSLFLFSIPWERQRKYSVPFYQKVAACCLLGISFLF